MTMTTSSHPFDVDTQAEKIADGEYAATISDRWTALTGTPNGGYLLALALRTLGGGLTHPDPLVASAFYLRPPRPGPATLRIEVVREGRRTTTGQANLLQEGREILRTVATFGDLGAATGRTLSLTQAPDLPPPDQCVDVLEGLPLPGISIVERFEYRSAKPVGFLRGEPGGDPTVEFWMRFREGREVDVAALPLLVDAAAPAVLELGEAGSATVELTVHVRARPAPGWLACRTMTRHVAGGFHEEDFEVWDSTGTLVAQSRQFAILQ